MDAAAARPLLKAMPVLVRRHAVMIATYHDPDLVATANAESPVGSSTSTARRSRWMCSSGARALGVLRALGAVVVDTEPERLGAACVPATSG